MIRSAWHRIEPLEGHIHHVLLTSIINASSHFVDFYSPKMADCVLFDHFYHPILLTKPNGESLTVITEPKVVHSFDVWVVFQIYYHVLLTKDDNDNVVNYHVLLTDENGGFLTVIKRTKVVHSFDVWVVFQIYYHVLLTKDDKNNEVNYHVLLTKRMG